MNFYAGNEADHAVQVDGTEKNSTRRRRNISRSRKSGPGGVRMELGAAEISAGRIYALAWLIHN